VMFVDDDDDDEDDDGVALGRAYRASHSTKKTCRHEGQKGSS
jgi:hypothetical protein